MIQQRLIHVFDLLRAYLGSLRYLTLALSFLLICIFLTPIVALDSLSHLLDASHQTSKQTQSFSHVSLLVYALKIALFLVAGYLFMRQNTTRILSHLVLLGASFPLIVKYQYFIQQTVYTYLIAKPNVLNKLSTNERPTATAEAFFAFDNQQWAILTGIYLGLFLLAGIFAYVANRRQHRLD